MIKEINAYLTNERLPRADSFKAAKAMANAIQHLLKG
jgi:hypothetical protein